ncbi:hypothetical protein EYF80_051676 [Liparis tanakae]|uniref:Uncharacterized protein n=1 Tax=Liparis tanakae TaxID=230148 RepID=A0A4Z2FB86_9TELE|nr:hypothetical protein EYF80_051676 [Liparis tanakae]
MHGGGDKDVFVGNTEFTRRAQTHLQLNERRAPPLPKPSNRRGRGEEEAEKLRGEEEAERLSV